MFNRLSSYWYSSTPQQEETQESQEERAEQVRRRRLAQFDQEAVQENASSEVGQPETAADSTDNNADVVLTTTENPDADVALSTTDDPDAVVLTTSNNPDADVALTTTNNPDADVALTTTNNPDADVALTTTNNPDGVAVEQKPQVIGSAIVKPMRPDTTAWQDDPWSDASTPHTQRVVDPAVAVSHVISRIFNVTLSTAAQPPSQPRFQTMLLDTAVSSELLSLDILDQVLFERLSMSAPELAECQVECGEARCPSFEPLIITYLLNSVRKCDEEMRCSKVHQETVLGCRDAAVRMMGIVLLSNDSWEPQDPAQQLVECLISTEHTFSEFNSTNNIKVLEELLAQDSISEDDLRTMMNPVVRCLIRKTTMCNLNTSPLNFSILTTLNILVANKTIAKMVPEVEGWKPDNPDDGAAYQSTLIGRFLSCSTMRHALPVGARYTSPYFNRGSAVNPDITRHSQSQYQQMIDRLQTLLSKFIYLLVKSPAKEEMLHWLARCLDANRNKAKLVASFLSTGSASDGFMLNLAGVLLKLSTPFLGPSNPRLSTVDVRFCGPESCALFPQQGEDKILDKIEEVQVSKEDLLSLGKPVQFNFISTCFYLTHRALQLAYVSPFDKYRRLMKSLMETQRLIEDVGGNPMSAEIRERFEAQYIEQLEVKTHLLHPDIVSHALLFYSSSANWLSLISISHDSPTVPDMKKKPTLPALPSKCLAMIPSYFISAMCQFLINVRHFAEASLENFLSDNLDHLITFLVMFCNKTWVPNPHTRAEIVEAVTVFIPNDRSAVSTSNREAALRSNGIAKGGLGGALISVFVDIEHSAPFDHKFQYRYHIFEILQYIWPKSSFNLPRLTFEVKGREEDTTVLFTKFIKLLMNDANFLLDEALHNLEEIKKIQTLQENSEEWGNLDETARQSKLKSLADLKRMCTSHNILAYETVNCLRYMTTRGQGMSSACHRSVTYAFVTPLLVDTLVTMLNYYLKELVGTSRTKYRVRNLEEVKFKPGELLQSIVAIYINLRHEDSFISAIPRDGRSYHESLFSETVSKLQRLNVNQDVIEELMQVSKLAEDKLTSQHDEEALADLAPSQYLDPILGTLMVDPVMLPASNVVVDRSVIAKHLLSDPIDPFNRQPLTMADVVPQEELKEEIAGWMREQLQLLRAGEASSSS